MQAPLLDPGDLDAADLDEMADVLAAVLGRTVMLDEHTVGALLDAVLPRGARTPVTPPGTARRFWSLLWPDDPVVDVLDEHAFVQTVVSLLEQWHLVH